MEKAFQSRRTWWFGLIFWFSILVSFYALYMIISNISQENYLELAIPALLMISSAGLLLWIWFGTGYKITEDYISYTSGPIRGKIQLDKIRKIESGRTMWSGLRPALAMGGIIIHYGTYDSIYISPDSNETFIQHLLSRRPDLSIEKKMFS